MNIYYQEESGNYTLIESKSKDEDSIAYAIYNKSYERTGWDFLAISSYDKNDNKYDDSKKAYAMGYLEGYLTKDRIYSYYINLLHYSFYDNNLTVPENLKEFFKTNIQNMEKNSLKFKETDVYWEYVYYIYQQILGLYNGYIDAIEKDKIIDFYEFLVFIGFGDTMDIIEYLDENKRVNVEKMDTEEIKRFILLNSHCSALIKLADDFNDIWFGHNTWFTYTSMIRIFKEYRFVSNKGAEKSKTMAFSSYPATLCSLDDFYFLESKLLVMETSNSIYNSDLYKNVRPDGLLTCVRVMVANRLASSAEEWTNIFKKENSGTYNNQFMILDLNKIDLKNKIIPDKSLMIIEQIPGETEVNDVTSKLKNDNYWPSYNVPYSKYFYEKSGYTKAIEERPGLIYSINYTECSRAKIFQRDQSKIHSNDDFKAMLRYNDYENDEFSYKDSTLTIACRYDLVYYSCYGTTDAKFVSVKELLEGKFYAHIISGPTNEKQPTFSWKNTKCFEKQPTRFYHEGLIETWDFDWIDYKVQLFENKSNNNNDKDNKNKTLIISLCIAGSIILIIAIIIIIARIKSKHSSNKSSNEISEIPLIEN